MATANEVPSDLVGALRFAGFTEYEPAVLAATASAHAGYEDLDPPLQLWVVAFLI